MRRLLILLAMLPLGGCYVPPPHVADTSFRVVEPTSGRAYWLFVPSQYNKDRLWPLVVTLHGTYGFDGARRQAAEWVDVADQHGLIVAAPELNSVQGVLPVLDSLRMKDLQDDEKFILAVIDDVSAKYRVDLQTLNPDGTKRRPAVLLTGFSAGGYPMWHTGLRNPLQFSMLIGRGANCDQSIFDAITITDDVRATPIGIIYGKDELGPIYEQSWQAFKWLREKPRSCLLTVRKEYRGGHLRRPAETYQMWRNFMPPEDRM